jgi:hypothetical protein
MGEKRNAYRVWVRKPKRDFLGGLCACGKRILIWSLKIQWEELE